MSAETDKNDHETAEGNQVRVRRPLNDKLINGILISIVGLAGYGLLRVGSDGVNKVGEVIGGVVNPRPDKPVFPLDHEGRRTPEFDRELALRLETSLNTYNGWQAYGKNLQTLLHSTQSKETVRVLDQIGKGYIVEGTNAMQTAWLLGHSEDKAFINQNGESLWINDDHYNLRDRFQAQLAGAWLQTSLSKIHRELKINLSNKEDDLGEWPIEVSSFQEDLSFLTWFKKQNVPIDFTDESFIHFPREEMVKVARIYQAVYKLGFNPPKSVEWCSSSCLDHIENVGAANLLLNKAIIENVALADTFAHEIGHLVSGQNNLMAEYSTVRGHNGTSSPETRLSHVSEYAMKNYLEDFAETFEEYILKGSYFRSVLAELKVSAPQNYQILQAKYNFMRDVVFKGEEFSYDGKVRDPILEEIEKEFLGFRWSIENRRLEVNPNPDAWPNKKSFSVTLPVLRENQMQNINLRLELNRRKGSYELYLGDPGLLKELRMSPLPGHNRVQVDLRGFSKPSDSKDDNSFSRQIENGIYPVKQIPIEQTTLKSLYLEAKSYSPITLGQIRVIRDNDFIWTNEPVVLRGRNNNILDFSEQFRLRDGSDVQIIEGPRQFRDTDTGVNRDYWLVSAAYRSNLEGLPEAIADKYLGWVSERWIGEEVKPNS